MAIDWAVVATGVSPTLNEWKSRGRKEFEEDEQQKATCLKDIPRL